MALKTVETGSQQTQGAAPAPAWHVLDAGTVANHADIRVKPEQGLSDAEVQAKLATVGANELVERGIKSPWAILWEQLTNPLVLLLIAAAVVSGLLGKWDSLIAIGAIVVINAVLGVVQEYRAEQAMAALKKMAAPLVRVRRGGHVLDVPARDIVPGDVVLLEAGSVVPADARLYESANLRVQEAALTGESQPVEKDPGTLQDAGAPLGDRHNMVYMGTSVTYGRATALVVHTGMGTQLGRIAALIQTVEADKTPLQLRLEELGKVLFGAALAVMLLAFVIGFVTARPGQSLVQILQHVGLNAVAIAVAVVPEGLPAVVTIALALGAQRMLKRNALIRKLAAVETLGSVTTICSDKTGTLTENRMTLTVVDVGGATASVEDVLRTRVSTLNGSAPAHTVAQAITLMGSALCNDAVVERRADAPEEFHIVGDPTEGALVLAAAKYDLLKTHLDAVLPRVGEVPFESDRKRMSTVHNPDEHIARNDEEEAALKALNVPRGQYVAFTKGAVDNILTVTGSVWIEGVPVPLTPELRARIEAANNRLAQEGLRVLGLAYRVLAELPHKCDVESIEHDLVFVGMVGIIDPPRKEVKNAVATCKQAGIRPMMITGDHPLTAFAIARELGIAKDGDRVLTGHDLSQMDGAALREAVQQVSVYARVSPEHKLNIVEALQANGQVAAMTGDGVNDAPALKRANIGVAMGITGTAVSKEASDMVLVDDNFTTIVSAVEEGRTIYDNVRRFIKYLLASNTGELFVLLMSQMIAGMGLPLTTLQILWMNLITDGIPALALGVERSEKGGMNRAPYKPNESLFGRGLGRHIVIVGLVMGIAGLLLGVWAFQRYRAEVAPVAGLTLDQMVEAQRERVDLSNADAVARRAAELGIAPEQLVAALEADNAMTYNAQTWNTMLFIFLTVAQMGHALGLRSHRESLFSTGLAGNRLLVGAVMVTITLQLIAVYTPFFNVLFNTTPLNAEQLAVALLVSPVVLAAVELEKLAIRRGWLKA